MPLALDPDFQESAPAPTPLHQQRQQLAAELHQLQTQVNDYLRRWSVAHAPYDQARNRRIPVERERDWVAEKRPWDEYALGALNATLEGLWFDESQKLGWLKAFESEFRDEFVANNARLNELIHQHQQLILACIQRPRHLQVV